MDSPFRSAGEARPEPPGIEPPAICGRCGVVAPSTRGACSNCQGRFDEVRCVAPRAPDGAYWVAVRAAFTCRGCAFLAPLDHLAADGAVECAQCGLRQAFDPSSWVPALDHAHAVGDLAGPPPEGRTPHARVWIGSDNPYSGIGVNMTFAQMRADDAGPRIALGANAPDGLRRLLGGGAGGAALTFEATPGHPVCRRCALPLDIAWDPLVTATRCSRCGEGARHELSERAGQLHPGLIGVVADELSDRPRARVATSPGGAVALQCPACGAPLQVSGAERVATCQFCKAVAILPRHGALGAGAAGGEAKPAIWWMLFNGASPARRALETPGREPLDAEAEASPFDFAAKVAAMKRQVAQRGQALPARAVATAPERPGPDVVQIVVTVVCAVVAIGITYPLVAGSISSGTPTHHPSRPRRH